MRFAFEVRETDLLGRIGTLRVGAKTLETPYLFPVVHPVNQGVPFAEMKSMGFGGLMTNSYIIHSRRKDEALNKGLHEMLGYDGVFMTDSGGYQVLEYGDLGVDYREMASFQAAIGSEIAVTLDRPTGYPQSRRVAKETMEYSLANALATQREYGGKYTVWVGPIQGGLYDDLLRKSAREMVKGGFQYLALGSPTKVMENYMFADLVRMVVAARRAMPYSLPLHLFGAGHPLTMALSVALGCDTFDSASYVLFARAGRYMTRGGVLSLELMKYLPCSCPVCTKQSVSGLREMDHAERTKLLSAHNLWVLREELELSKEALNEGRLWDLVEERSMAHPRLREAFKEMAKHSALLAEGTPAHKDRGLFVRSQEDFSRPELLIAGKRLAGAVRRSSKSALLLGLEGTSARRRGGGPKRAAMDDAFRVNAALGPYPVELDFVYPFTQTEATGDLAADPVSALKKLGYGRIRKGGTPRAKAAVKSRLNRRAASPSPRSSSARPR